MNRLLPTKVLFQSDGSPYGIYADKVTVGQIILRVLLPALSVPSQQRSIYIYIYIYSVNTRKGNGPIRSRISIAKISLFTRTKLTKIGDSAK
jgi:hypothetical protein